jgi:4-diphosphocytidyl-2-C-methyl-D-erythritol kinase
LIRTIAPAKINWTLEVLGKRPDGYHEVRTLMQTIDICDEVKLYRAPELLRDVRPEREPRRGDLVGRVFPHSLSSSGGIDFPGDSGLTPFYATQRLDPEGKRDVRISLKKRIPVAAGLGGGSSDAAATLRGLDRLWELGLDREALSQVARGIGADVAFFLTGGTALAEGRGEMITPLPDAPVAWLVVVAPPILVQEKTRTMYGALRSADFTDGELTEGLAKRLSMGEPVGAGGMCNAFERAAYVQFEGLAAYREGLLGAGAATVHLAGAGPALFAVFGSQEAAEAVAGRMAGSDASIFVARTLGAAEATRLESS